ncbi:MAG: hypothetical protein WAU82_12105 [Candidatus Binatus sp.]|uniref:hypothetical protein n=1 Tax=Candidatus Binatus sp. TaxID=2811406 RepID=UPI003BB146AC
MSCLEKGILESGCSREGYSQPGKGCIIASFSVLLLILFFSSSPGLAQQTASASTADDEAALAEREYDPTASLTQFKIQDIYTPSEYGTNAQPNTLQLRPLLAVRPQLFTPLEQLIRPSIQIVTVPRNKGATTTTALDDFQLLDLFVMPWPNEQETRFRWGVGPYFVFPTSTSQYTGRGAWQIGPAWAFSYRKIPGLNIAGLFQQATSFAYSSSHSVPVSSLQIQPMLSYQLGRGWYVKSSDATWTINWRHKTSTQMPLSAGFGKVWKFGAGYAIDTSFSTEWMVYRQFSTQTEQFALRFQMNLLLPQLQL